MSPVITQDDLAPLLEWHHLDVENLQCQSAE